MEEIINCGHHEAMEQAARVAVDASLLEEFRARLNGILSNLVQWR